MDLTVGGKFKVTNKIGSGSFGDIYECVDIDTHKKYAVKLESTSCKLPQLLYEAKLYKILAGGTGIPNVHWYGIETKNGSSDSKSSSESGAKQHVNCMVIDKLGKSLEDLFEFCKRKFTLKTVCMIADQILHRMEYFHSRSFIHRDIKPENFLIGTGKVSNVIHLIDYGLGKMYRNIKTGKHIDFKDGRSLTGTARYASINVHLGYEQSRRDDLLSIGYMLIYFMKGTLPWVGIQAQTKKEKYDLIREKKEQTSNDMLCDGENPAFLKYFEYCSNLEFDQKPKYSFLRSLFKDAMKSICEKYDYEFDWVIRSNAIKAVQLRKNNQENMTSTVSTKNVNYNSSDCNYGSKGHFKSNKSIRVLKSENGGLSNISNNKHKVGRTKKKASKESQIKSRRDFLMAKSTNIMRHKESGGIAYKLAISKQNKGVASANKLINSVKCKEKQICNNLSIRN